MIVVVLLYNSNVIFLLREREVSLLSLFTCKKTIIAKLSIFLKKIDRQYVKVSKHAGHVGHARAVTELSSHRHRNCLIVSLNCGQSWISHAALYCEAIKFMTLYIC